MQSTFNTSLELEQTNPVRGMKDRFGEENRRFQWIAEKGGKLASLYGFDQVLQQQEKGSKYRNRDRVAVRSAEY